MNIIIVHSGQKFFFEACLASLNSTVDRSQVSIHVVEEMENREATLNFILKNYGAQDCLIIGDDMILTENWYASLESAKKFGDIIGFSTLYPETNTVQDTGYDLVKINDKILLRPENRGKILAEIDNFKFRECDTVNGCALFIKKRVIEKFPTFNLDGKNRWGEFLYTYTAKNAGFKVLVLDHFLYHHGKGTKNNPDKSLSSESYLLEQKIWQAITNQYVEAENIKTCMQTTLSDKLQNLLISQDRVIFYGAGTISEFIYSKLSDNPNLARIDFCSGLQEEEGKTFCGRRIQNYKNVDFVDCKSIIITVLQKEDQIFALIKDFVKELKVYYITQTTIGTITELDLQLYKMK